MFFVYLVIIVICFCLLKSYFGERALSGSVQKEEQNTAKILLLNIGKKTNAFTIEKTKFVYGVSVISTNLLHKVWLYVRKFFMPDCQINNYLKSLSARNAISVMKKNAENAEYIINTKIDHIHLSTGKILAHAYGTAVYLYKDTLGLFLFPEDRALPPTKKIEYNFYLRSLKAITLCCTLIALLYYSYHKYSLELANRISYQDETAIWSYIKDSVLENRALQQKDLAEAQLQKLIDDLATSNLIPADSFAVYLLNSEDIDIFIYPGGNITITTSMLKQIETQNALTFLLANEVGHYLKKHNLVNLSTELVSIYNTLRLLGEDSFIANIFIRASLFSNIKFDLNQEEEADKFALSVTNHYYSHASGPKEALLKLNQLGTNAKYFEHHTINQDRIANLDMLISNNNYIAGQTKPLGITTYEPSPQTTNKKASSEDLISLYNQDTSFLYTNYKHYLSAFNSILALPINVSLEDLNQRYYLLQNALKEIASTSVKFDELTNNYDHKIYEMASKLETQDQARTLLVNWDKTKKSVKKTFNFYFTQDYNVLETEQLIIDFLRKRYGSFTINQSGIVFNSAAALERYNTLVARLNQYLNQKPAE